MYFPSIYSIFQAASSIIQLTNLYKTCWKDFSVPYLLILITDFAAELK